MIIGNAFPVILIFIFMCTIRVLYLIRKIRKHRKVFGKEFTSIVAAMQSRSASERLSFVKELNESSGKLVPATLKIVCVLGSGGHTTEMIHLMRSLHRGNIQRICYVIAMTDTTSEQRTDAFENQICKKQGFSTRHVFSRIPRSREVGQSYLSSVYTTLYSFFFAFMLVVNEVRFPTDRNYFKKSQTRTAFILFSRRE